MWYLQIWDSGKLISNWCSRVGTLGSGFLVVYLLKPTRSKLDLLLRIFDRIYLFRLLRIVWPIQIHRWLDSQNRVRMWISPQLWHLELWQRPTCSDRTFPKAGVKLSVDCYAQEKYLGMEMNAHNRLNKLQQHICLTQTQFLDANIASRLDKVSAITDKNSKSKTGHPQKSQVNAQVKMRMSIENQNFWKPTNRQNELF